MNGKWVKLELGNDWGVRYYAHKAFTEYGTASASRGIPFQEGQLVKVRWPDGTITDEKLIVKKFYDNVSDHGKSSAVSYHLAVIDKLVLGLPRTFSLNEVEILESALPRKILNSPTKAVGKRSRPKLSRK